MEKWMISFWVVVFVSMSMAARADTGDGWAKKLYMGAHVGLDLSTFGGPGANDATVRVHYKPGFGIGGLAGIRLDERFAGQLEIAFTSKGPKSTTDGMDSGTYHMSYLEVPILARVAFPGLGRVEPYAVVGPTLGVLLGADLALVDGRNIDLSDRLERMDIGLILGAGAAMELGDKGAVTFDIRYNFGLRNLDKTIQSEDDEVMSRTVYFMVGYRTDLGFLAGGSYASLPQNRQTSPVNAQPPAASPTNIQSKDEGMPGNESIAPDKGMQDQEQSDEAQGDESHAGQGEP